MTETFKEHQINTLFNPRTVNDKEAVVLLGSLGRLTDAHKGDPGYANMVAVLGAIIITLVRSGELDEALVQKEIRKLYDEYMPPESAS